MRNDGCAEKRRRAVSNCGGNTQAEPFDLIPMDTLMPKSMIIGICGGTGSGKTTVAQKIIASIGEPYAVYLQQDSYYRNLEDMPLDQRQRVNFDHPDAYDGGLMLSHLEGLRAGKVSIGPFMILLRTPANGRQSASIRCP